MVPVKMEKPPFLPENQKNDNNININLNTNNIIQENKDPIPYPRQIDREQSRNLIPHTINQLKEIQDLHIQNMNNYKRGDVCRLVYSEEEYPERNKFISYDKLVDLINIKEPLDKNAYKKFKYLNYDKTNEILFSSNFESGNLRYAIKLSNHEYDLILRPETDCIRTYHWFFFRCEINTLLGCEKFRENKVVKFNIINLYKKTVLFSEKIRILSYYNDAWSRDTFNIHYFINGIPYNLDGGNIEENNFNFNENNNNNVFNLEKNSSNNLDNILNGNNQEGMKYHTLSFSFDFSQITTPIKYIYFAYCYPYSFTQLDLYLSSLNHYKDILRFDEIGKSLEGNSLHMLIITNFTDSFDELANKKSIIFTARVHPGESNGSYVIQGVLEYLLSNDPGAKNLRKNFIFKIVPMLNPDGVIRGNFRMNILGKDLNRMWDEPTEETCPTIFNTVKMIKKTLDSRDIYFFCDFHGHSNKHNFFLYSCKSKYDYLQLDENTIIPNPQKYKLTFYELVFQFILNRENTFLDRFSCTNKIIPSKTKTSRAILKTKYNVDFSYCLESSIAAMKTKEGNTIPFTINTYKKIGKDFCIALNKLIDPKIFFSVLSTVRFSKNEKCSLYNKNKVKGKMLFLPYINNIGGSTNNLNNSNNNGNNNNNNNNNGNKGNNNNNSMNSGNNFSKSSKTNNLNVNNNNGNNNITKSNSNNKINNYFHKLSGKVNTNNNSNNTKGVMSKYKSSMISNSAINKDNNKNNSFKYNNKLKRSFEAIKYP